MRLTKDLEFENMNQHEVTERLRKINEYNDDSKLNVLINRLKTYERTRHLMMWHDGSSRSAHSHLLMMILCLRPSLSFD